VTNQSTTDEGVMPVATAPDHTTKFREEADVGQALLDTADAIADMAQRVQLNGPEPVYASEKLGHALYKAAEGLALCDVELEEVTAETHRGYRHGRCLREEER
jgi:hypothetical protein